MAMADAGCPDLPADVLVDILLRLPPSSRRRVRIVCRLWRDVIGERTMEMQGLPRPSFGTPRKRERVGGAVTLVNPATGEVLPVPALPCADLLGRSFSWSWEYWDKAYNFAYHPTTGQYKVVHVPCRFNHECKLHVPCTCRFDHECKFDTIQVLTLGKASWREMETGIKGDGRCHLDAGIISIDGTTYWVTEDPTIRVVSFDLDHERVTYVKRLPAHPTSPDHYHLTEVHGRLGIVFANLSATTEVWILDEGLLD
ncbi:hypothetical protein VPH35_024233 [Triticum aestivum]